MLREAGVVDAGGYGVTIIFAGIVAALRGTEGPELDHYEPPAHADAGHAAARVLDLPLLHELRRDRPRTCRPRKWLAPLETLGDSVLVVGDEATLKVHVHTDEPDLVDRRCSRTSARSRGSTSPTCTRRSPSARRPPRRRGGGRAGGVRGAGRRRRRRACARCSRGSACSVVDGGPTLNPSTYELLAGIHDVPAEEVVVLPNSANVVHGRRARRRAVGEGRRASCRPRSQQAG